MGLTEKIKAIALGRYIAKKVIRKAPHSTIVFTNDRIGDTCIQLAWIEAFKRINKIEHITCLTTETIGKLAPYFSTTVDRFFFIEKKELQILLQFYKSDFGYLFYRKHQNLICTFPTAHVRDDVIKNPSSLNFASLTRAIYHLPADLPACKLPEIGRRNVDELVKAGVIVPGKTVLLNPNAQTITQTPISFFEHLASKLIADGYSVLCSVHGNEKVVKGTEGIEFPITQAVALSNACGMVVGARSGFMDIVAFSGAKAVSIDNDGYDYSGYFDYTAWGKENLLNLKYEFKEEERIIASIMEFFEG